MIACQVLKEVLFIPIQTEYIYCYLITMFNTFFNLKSLDIHGYMDI